jgi:trehalose 6-phosphate phosphatase
VTSERAPPLQDPATSALFLDVDGTLLEFAEQPMAVVVPERLRALLADLQRACGGALALVSGREIATIDRLFGMPELAVAGLHGLERRDGSGNLRRRPAPGPTFADLERRLAGFVHDHPGVTLEHKRVALAVHYRAAPAQAAAVAALADALEADLPAEFRVQRGHQVVEVRPAGADKGVAIGEFLAEAPFAGRRPVFIGDDLTDEHGFAVVNAAGGLSVKVGDGPSAASYRLPEPAAVHRWLAALLSSWSDHLE